VPLLKRHKPLARKCTSKAIVRVLYCFAFSTSSSEAARGKAKNLNEKDGIRGIHLITEIDGNGKKVSVRNQVTFDVLAEYRPCGC